MLSIFRFELTTIPTFPFVFLKWRCLSFHVLAVENINEIQFVGGSFETSFNSFYLQMKSELDMDTMCNYYDIILLCLIFLFCWYFIG